MTVPTWPEFNLIEAERIELLHRDPQAVVAAAGFGPGALVYRAETLIHGRHATAAVAVAPEVFRDLRFSVDKYVRGQLGASLAGLAAR